jgi:hypothetical protein
MRRESSFLYNIPVSSPRSFCSKIHLGGTKMNSPFVHFQRPERGKVLPAAFTKALRVQGNVQMRHLGVPVPGPFSVEVLAAGVARKRRLEAVDLGHVRQQHPLGHKLCPALFTDDRLLQCPLLSVQVRSAKK